MNYDLEKLAIKNITIFCPFCHVTVASSEECEDREIKCPACEKLFIKEAIKYNDKVH